MDVDPTVSRHEIGTLVGAFNQEKALVGAFFVIVKSSWTFVWSSFTNCHLHSCLRPWCGLEERIWWNHEYEYEESRSRQTSLTGLDRQLASRTSDTTQIFFSAVYQLLQLRALPPQPPARPLLPCHETQCSIRSLTSGWTPCWCRGPRHRGHLQ